MQALDGIRVVDLSHAISGPTCTNMLVQLGADVIKVEKPGVGDIFRHYTEHAGLPMMSIPFAAINAGKRSLTLDIRKPEGRELFLKLLEGADVLVENFKPGTLARIGFDPAKLRERFPRLITCSISGFGQTGPLASRGAYDHIAQASSGLSMMNSVGDTPQKIGIPIVDSFSGYIAVIGVLAAIQRRGVTGQGENLDVSMLDSALKLLNTSVATYFATGEIPKGLGNRGYRLVATSEFYRTADGWIALGANQQHQIEKMCEVIGRPDLLADPRFADHAARLKNYDSLKGWLTDFFATQSASDLEERLSAVGVPIAMIRDIGQIAHHPQLDARGTLRDGEMPAGQPAVKIVGTGFESGAPASQGAVPVLGADNDAILAELGLDANAIAALRREAVI